MSTKKSSNEVFWFFVRNNIEELVKVFVSRDNDGFMISGKYGVQGVK